MSVFQNKNRNIKKNDCEIKVGDLVQSSAPLFEPKLTGLVIKVEKSGRSHNTITVKFIDTKNIPPSCYRLIDQFFDFHLVKLT
jgi:hypothetical protein